MTLTLYLLGQNEMKHQQHQWRISGCLDFLDSIWFKSDTADSNFIHLWNKSSIFQFVIKAPKQKTKTPSDSIAEDIMLSSNYVGNETIDFPP